MFTNINNILKQLSAVYEDTNKQINYYVDLVKQLDHHLNSVYKNAIEDIHNTNPNQRTPGQTSALTQWLKAEDKKFFYSFLLDTLDFSDIIN